MAWIVAATKPKAEFIAKMHLERQGYDAYLPLVVSPERHDPHPMFPGYLFISPDALEGIWRPIRSTVGIVAVLMNGIEPSKVPECVINLLQRREEAGVIRLRRREAVAQLHPGQAVRIYEGPFSGFEAVFQRESTRDCVRVLLTYLGKTMPVDVPAEAVA